MSYFQFNATQRSKIAFGCLVALGSVTVAGIAEVEIQEKLFSKWIDSISETIKSRSQSSRPTETTPVTAEHIFFPFTYIGQEVGKIAVQVWSFLSEASDVIGLIKAGWKELLGSIWKFLSNLIDPKIFNKVFENIHKKIWNLISFPFSGGKSRDQFVSLFKGEKKTSTFLAAKFLLGQPIPGNKYFKSRPNVFSYLLLSWMDRPSEVTDKFDRLSKTIKRLTDKLEKNSESSSSSSSSEDDEDKVYWLEIPTVQDYLDVKKGIGEDIFNAIWTTEIMSKITTGTDYTYGAKTWALLGNMFA